MSKIPKIDIKSYIISFLVVHTGIFLLSSLFTWSLLEGLIFTVFISIIITPIVIFSDIYGKYKHKSIHNSKLFNGLKLEGFETEQINDYIGLVKLVNKSTVRIYFDWNKYAKGFLSFGDIVINVFIEPLLINEGELLINKKLLKELNKKYKERTYIRASLYITPDRIVANINYYPRLSLETVKEEIYRCLSIFDGVKIKPINIDDAKFKDYVFLPNIELVDFNKHLH